MQVKGLKIEATVTYDNAPDEHTTVDVDFIKGMNDVPDSVKSAVDHIRSNRSGKGVKGVIITDVLYVV